MAPRAPKSNRTSVAEPSNTQERRRQKAAAGPCPIMRSCGGCAWLGTPYRKQLTRKQASMDELFGPLIERFGWGISIDPIQGMGATAGKGAKATPPRAFRYKASTPFAPGPRGEVRCGFFAAGTHRIVPAKTCPVEAHGARDILNGVARVAEELGIPAYDEDARRGILRYAVVRMGWRVDEALLTVVTTQRDFPHDRLFFQRVAELDPRIACVAQNINGRSGNAVLGRETLVVSSADHMSDRLLGCIFEISPTAFYQTNPQQTELLYRLAIDGMELETGDTLLDAYCGSGTIGLCAAHEAARTGTDIQLIGVELNQAGVADAERNAELNGLADRATFIADDATSFLRRRVQEGMKVDVLSMDPPRAGSTPEFLSAAASAMARRIIYISCNPASQARDLEVLGVAGYRLERLTPVDMFPHTPHVETVACLVRS